VSSLSRPACNGWAKSKADGSFRLAGAGEFVSFRHADYKPELFRSSDLTEPAKVQLAPADDTVWKPKPCAVQARKGSDWIGGGLRVQEEIIKARSMESTTRIGTFRAEEIDFTWLTVMRGTQVYRWNRS